MLSYEDFKFVENWHFKTSQFYPDCCFVLPFTSKFVNRANP